MTHASPIRKLRSFARRTPFEQLWFAPVWLMLGISRMLILVVPFRIFAAQLGEHTTAAWIPLLDTRHASRARLVGRVVQMAAKYTLRTSNCFPQEVTTRLLLGLYGIPCSIFFGIKRTSLEAHAWVAAGQIQVVGGENFGQFTVVGCFVSDCPN